MRFTVVLDACVLYPSLLRDLLMRLSIVGLFKAHWTEQIHDEWIAALLRKHPQLDKDKLLRTKQLMNAHSNDALVENYEDIIPQLKLPDANDRHVLAAAIKSRSDAIVTFNAKDFPVDYLQQYDIEILHPDDFIHYQVDLSPSRVCSALKSMREALKAPPFTQRELILSLEKNQLPSTANALSEFIEHI